MLRALTLVLLVLLVAPAGAAAQSDLPVAPPVPVPGAPAGEQPAGDDAPPAPPSPAPTCNPELQACGQPCAPDVDDGCAPECACAPGGGGADDEESGAVPDAGDGGDRRGPGRTRPVGAGGVRPVVTAASSGSPGVAARKDELPATGAEPPRVAIVGLVLLLAGLRLRAAGQGGTA